MSFVLDGTQGAELDLESNPSIDLDSNLATNSSNENLEESLTIENSGENLCNETVTQEFESNNDEAKRCTMIQSFEELNIQKQIMEGFKRELNIETPNELQMKIMFELVTNRTESIFIKSSLKGKKIAFLMAAIHRIDVDLKQVQCLVLQPTSELVAYTANIAKDVCKSNGVLVDFLTDCASIDEMIGGHMIFATLSSFIHFLEKKKIGKKFVVNCVIFDEVDNLMCSKESYQMIMQINLLLKGRIKQYQFFSNTIGDYALKRIQKDITDNLVIIDLFNIDCLQNYLQFYTFSKTKRTKFSSLVKLLKNNQMEKVLIYANFSNCSDFLNYSLNNLGFKNVMRLNKSTPANEILITVNNFNRLKTAILILNYPICLGLPLNSVKMIIMYSLPRNPHLLRSQYFHQISKCDFTDTGPNFVVNMLDETTDYAKREIEECFGVDLIKLKTDNFKTS